MNSDPDVNEIPEKASKIFGISRIFGISKISQICRFSRFFQNFRISRTDLQSLGILKSLESPEFL